MNRASIALLSLATLSTLGGCGLGRVSEKVVDLYDTAAPAGLMEIELERDGSIREMEADVDPSQLPAVVREAAMAAAEGGRISGAEREYTLEAMGWEVKVDRSGTAWEFVFDEEGNLLETEREIDRSEAPRSVLEAADRAVPGGTFVSVEVIEQQGEALYHVKKERDGARYKVVVDRDARILRAVREHRAEIEIPLAGS